MISRRILSDGGVPMAVEESNTNHSHLAMRGLQKLTIFFFQMMGQYHLCGGLASASSPAVETPPQFTKRTGQRALIIKPAGRV
jgi:hypothetical protein